MAIGNGRTSTSRLIQWRVWVQAAFLLAWLDPLVLRMHNICGPVFHCYSCPLATFACPIGVISNFSALHIFPFLAVGTLLIAGTLLGSFICGWVCPFGFLQDLAAKVPIRKFALPGWTGHFRYVVLTGLVVAVPFLFGESHPLFFCRVCPAGALEGAVPNMISQAIAGESIAWASHVKLVILAVFLVAMFLAWRPWCTLLCPLGAIYSLFNRVSVFYLRYHTTRCTSCEICHDDCNHGLRPNEHVDGPRCIRCLECTRCGSITVAHVFEKPQDQTPSDTMRASKELTR